MFQYAYRNQKLEDDVDFIQNIVKAVRSVRGVYNITNKIKPDCKYTWFRCPVGQTTKKIVTLFMSFQYIAICITTKLDFEAFNHYT